MSNFYGKIKERSLIWMEKKKNQGKGDGKARTRRKETWGGWLICMEKKAPLLKYIYYLTPQKIKKTTPFIYLFFHFPCFEQNRGTTHTTLFNLIITHVFYKRFESYFVLMCDIVLIEIIDYFGEIRLEKFLDRQIFFFFT